MEPNDIFPNVTYTQHLCRGVGYQIETIVTMPTNPLAAVKFRHVYFCNSPMGIVTHTMSQDVVRHWVMKDPTEKDKKGNEQNLEGK
jgi:hypothetical protein